MNAAGAKVTAWDLLPELIGREAARRLQQESQDLSRVVRRKRREVTA